ncbi:MAG: hypothetical protein PUB00_04115 [Clostridiales bacterium]|nr:hypothetical protein [Clostridiales bacterium]
MEKKTSGEQRQSRLRSWFSLNRGNHGESSCVASRTQSKVFTEAIAFVLRERVDFIDALSNDLTLQGDEFSL